MRDKSNELFLSVKSVKDVLRALAEDVPNFDGGDYYTSKTTGQSYNSWRTKVDPQTESYLRGFKGGIEAALAVIGGQGGATLWGLLHLGCPYKIEEDTARMKEAGSYDFGGTSCECDRCEADVKRVDEANPRTCDCTSIDCACECHV